MKIKMNKKCLLLSFIILNCLASCKSSISNNYSDIMINTQVSSNQIINKDFNIEKDITKYFPVVSPNYELHYTIKQNQYKCPVGDNLSCATQVSLGYGSDDGYLKIKSNDSSTTTALLKLYNKEIQIKEKTQSFWQNICINLLNYQTNFVTNKKLKNSIVIWKVSSSEETIKIKGHELYPEHEDYTVREIRAKITGFENEAVFKVSKDFGIITFYFSNEKLLSGFKEVKYTDIGKFVKYSHTPIPVPSSIITPIPVTSPFNPNSNIIIEK